MFALSFLAAACGFVLSASASTLIYEPFDYTSGSTIVPGSTSTNSGNGLVDPYGPNAPTTWVEAGSITTGTAHHITGAGLTAPAGFPASIGNAAGLIGGASGHSDFSEMARMNLPGAPYGANAVLYYSALVNVADLTGLTTLHTNANANNDLIIGFNNNTGATATTPNTWAGELTIRQGSAASTFNLGIRGSTTAANTTFWSGDLNPATTYLVVGRFTEGATPGSGGVSDLWINPSSATFGAASAPSPDGSTNGTYSSSGTADHTNSILIGAGIAAGSNPNETDIDEIRVGTTWADVTSVTPEPGAISLMLLGAGAMVARRKRA
jgi:hypothetical protein